ncbi:DUF5388 domain-containing protein (plasmid) [Fructilactobacillus sp. Tb1]|uniref:DUF5388 domain-containing protein n=1 Tax=Fructilactobacillus sp. Tb1 TaxID=3422304 RepID=UPI003D280797
MSLTNNPNRDKKAKLIDRGTDIVPQNSVDINEVLLNNPDKMIIDSVTFYANVRINNHIKNKIQALSILGLANSQKDAIETAVNYYIESLPQETMRKFKTQVEVLEERDKKIK